MKFVPCFWNRLILEFLRFHDIADDLPLATAQRQREPTLYSIFKKFNQVFQHIDLTCCREHDLVEVVRQRIHIT